MNAIPRPSDRAFVPAASSPCGSRPKASIPRGEYGFARLARMEAAKRDIKDRYAALSLKLASDMQGELDEIDRRYWAGEALS